MITTRPTDHFLAKSPPNPPKPPSPPPPLFFCVAAEPVVFLPEMVVVPPLFPSTFCSMGSVSTNPSFSNAPASHSRNPFSSLLLPEPFAAVANVCTLLALVVAMLVVVGMVVVVVAVVVDMVVVGARNMFTEAIWWCVLVVVV